MNTLDNGRRERYRIYFDTVQNQKSRESKRFSQAFLAKALNITEFEYAELESAGHQLKLDIVFDICALINIA